MKQVTTPPSSDNEQSWSELFIRRPVLAWVLNIVVVILGIVAFFNLSLRQYPQVEQPIITVMTQFDGAGPEIIESQVTRPLEETLAGLEGLETITSESVAEQSKIKLIFRSTRPIDAAASDVRDRLSRMDKLPQEASHPRLTKADADAEPVVSLAFYGDQHEIPKLYDYVTRYLQSDFEAIPGVASVDVYGGASYEMHIVLDPIRMAGYNLTAQEVSEALKRQNINKPAGRIGEDEREFLVITRAQLSKPDDFNNLVLGERKGYLVKLRDVGYAEFNSDDKRFRVKYNGHSAVMMGVVAQSRANPIEISHAVEERLKELRDNLPRGMSLEIANDRSVFIERSIQHVYKSIWEAIFLVIAVVFFFLRSMKASLVPLITIPISLLGAFFTIYLLGFTINTLTLLALVLAIGLVVDDAIVVLENIYRHIENGLSPLKAAIIGTREIQFSIIAMTLTLVAVYTPIALASGITGKLFTEFALTLVGAVLWSGFVALVLSPMMCSRLLSAHTHHVVPQKTPEDSWIHSVVLSLRHFNQRIGVWLDRLDSFYAEILAYAFQYRTWILAGAFGIGLGGYLLGSYVIPSELAPREDQGVMKVTAQSPYGSTLEYLDRYANAIDKILEDVPEIDRRLLIVQAGEETYERAMLIPWEKRRRGQDLIPDIQKKLEEIPGIRAFAYCPSRSLMGGASERPLEFVIQTNRPFKELVSAASRVRRVMAQYPGVYAQTIDWDVAASGQEYLVDVKRDVAAASNVDIQALAVMLDMLISGRRATSVERESKLYPVRIWMGEANRKSPQDLKSLMVKGTRDRQEVMIPLEELVTIEEKVSNPAVSHFGGMRSVTIMAGLEKGYGLGEVHAGLKAKIREVLPAGFRIQEAGELKRFLTEKKTIFLIFGLAIAFIFLVMAAQFESFRDPFIIMLSVPLALAGAALTLWIVPGGSINIYSQIGFVTLIGLITKHGILIVDFANSLQEKGMTQEQALFEACRLRLRPILMTTLAMVLGAIPLVIGGGPGFEVRRQIGWVIVGGMSLGTFFTLFVVPLVYTLISNRSQKLEEQKLIEIG